MTEAYHDALSNIAPNEFVMNVSGEFCVDYDE